MALEIKPSAIAARPIHRALLPSRPLTQSQAGASPYNVNEHAVSTYCVRVCAPRLRSGLECICSGFVVVVVAATTAFWSYTRYTAHYKRVTLRRTPAEGAHRLTVASQANVRTHAYY